MLISWMLAISMALLLGLCLMTWVVQTKISLLMWLLFGLLIGLGGIAYLQLVYSLVGIGWSVGALLAPIVLFVGVTYFKFEGLKLVHFHLPSLRLKWYELLLFILIFLNLSSLVLVFLQTPDALGWDGMEIWFFKAKAFYIDSGVTSEFLDNPNGYYEGFEDTFYKSSYPIFLPLMISYVYLFLGGVSVFGGKLLWLLVLIIMLGIFYCIGSAVGNRTITLLMMFLLLTPQAVYNHMGMVYAGYADIFLAVYILSATGSWLLWEKTGKKTYIVLAYILAGIGASIKDDGLVYLLMLLGVSRIFSLMFIPAMILLPWWLLKYQLGLRSYFDTTIQIEYLIKAFRAFYRVASTKSGFYLTFWLVVLSSLLAVTMKYRLTVKLIILLIGCLVGYSIIYMFTPLEIGSHLKSSVDRLLFHLYPTAMLIPVLTLSEWYLSYTKSRKT